MSGPVHSQVHQSHPFFLLRSLIKFQKFVLLCLSGMEIWLRYFMRKHNTEQLELATDEWGTLTVSGVHDLPQLCILLQPFHLPGPWFNKIWWWKGSWKKDKDSGVWLYSLSSHILSNLILKNLCSSSLYILHISKKEHSLPCLTGFLPCRCLATSIVSTFKVIKGINFCKTYQNL
jgi:hypothetical protein